MGDDVPPCAQVLLSPLQLSRGVSVAGRVGLAPLTNVQSASDGCLGEAEFRWLLRRARGGFPWISTCAAYVSEEGKAWDGQLGVASERHVGGLARLGEALSARSVVGIVQLHHAGARADRAPGMRLGVVDGPGVRGATRDDVARVTRDFVEAAHRALRAGFSGVEIHGANGYLFTQFLSPTKNTREDAYGGGVEQRARFLREVLRAVRREIGTGGVVGVRISPIDIYGTRGLTLTDSLVVARGLAEEGADYVHLSLTDARARVLGHGSVVGAMRAILPSEVALVAAGGVWTPDDAVEVRRAGADLVTLGRVAIGHPDWPRRLELPVRAPSRPPWSRGWLERRDVGPPFLRYLERFPELLASGEGE